MWALLSSRLRTWLLLTVAVPLLARVLRVAGDQLERRRGADGLSRALQKAGDLTGRVARRGASGAAGVASGTPRRAA